MFIENDSVSINITLSCSCHYLPRAIFQLLVLLTIVFQLLNIIDCDINSDAIAFLHYFNRTAEQHYYDDNEANWIYQSNVTDHNAQLAAEADADFNQFLIQQAANASRFNEKYVRSVVFD
jgi:hypothetical protein